MHLDSKLGHTNLIVILFGRFARKKNGPSKQKKNREGYTHLGHNVITSSKALKECREQDGLVYKQCTNYIHANSTQSDLQIGPS